MIAVSTAFVFIILVCSLNHIRKCTLKNCIRPPQLDDKYSTFQNTHLKQSNAAALGFRDPLEAEGTTWKMTKKPKTNVSYNADKTLLWSCFFSKRVLGLHQIILDHIQILKTDSICHVLLKIVSWSIWFFAIWCFISYSYLLHCFKIKCSPRDISISHYPSLLYGSVSQGLGTTKFTNLIG